MAELLKDIQTYWDMRAGGFSDASMEERKTEPGKHWENISAILWKKGARYWTMAAVPDFLPPC